MAVWFCWHCSPPVTTTLAINWPRRWCQWHRSSIFNYKVIPRQGLIDGVKWHMVGGLFAYMNCTWCQFTVGFIDSGIKLSTGVVWHWSMVIHLELAITLRIFEIAFSGLSAPCWELIQKKISQHDIWEVIFLHTTSTFLFWNSFENSAIYSRSVFESRVLALRYRNLWVHSLCCGHQWFQVAKNT